MKRFLTLILASSLLALGQAGICAELSQGEIEFEKKKLSGEIPNTLQEYEAEQKAKQAADAAAMQAVTDCTPYDAASLKNLVYLISKYPGQCKQGNARNIFVEQTQIMLIEPLVLPKLQGAEYFNIQPVSGQSGKAVIAFPGVFEKFTGTFKPGYPRTKNCLIEVASDGAVIKNLQLINAFGPTVCIKAGVKNVTLEGNVLSAPNDQVIWWEEGVTNVTAKNNQFAGKNTAKVTELIQGDYDGIHTATGNQICDPTNMTASNCQSQEAFLQKKVDNLEAIAQQLKPSAGTFFPQGGSGSKVPQVTSQAQQQILGSIFKNTPKIKLPAGVIPGGGDDGGGKDAGEETGTVFPCAEGEALVNNPVLGLQCITLPDTGKDTDEITEPEITEEITDTTSCTGDVLLDLATNCCDPLTEIYDPKTSSCVPGPTVDISVPEDTNSEVITIGPLVTPPANQGDGGGCTLLSATHEPSLTVIGLFWGGLALLAALLFRTRPGDREDTTLHGRHA